MVIGGLGLRDQILIGLRRDRAPRNPHALDGMGSHVVVGLLPAIVLAKMQPHVAAAIVVAMVLADVHSRVAVTIVAVMVLPKCKPTSPEPS